MKIVHNYSSNHFAYTNIELHVFENGTHLFYTYQEPEDGKYHKSVKGKWRVKYKTIDAGYWCEGQKLKQMPEVAMYESTILCR